MDNQIIFLDIDGTLCDIAGNVTEDTRNAIHKAHENGHQFFLCTGRSKAEINDAVFSLPVSGLIGAGGGYIEIDEKVVFHKTLNTEALHRLLDFFKSNGVEYYLESNEGLYASTGLRKVLSDNILKDMPEDGPALLEHMNWFFELMIEDEDQIDFDHINKLSFINYTIPYKEIYDRFHEEFQVIPSTVPVFGPDSGEVGVKNIHKQTAIEYALNYLGKDKINTIAFGDGHNDVEMFAAVNHGIAMGNACDQLLAVADEVTASNTEDGIARALERHNLV